MTARLTLPLEISEMAEQKRLSAQSVIYDASMEAGKVCVCVSLHLLHIEYVGWNFQPCEDFHRHKTLPFTLLTHQLLTQTLNPSLTPQTGP